jgi:hypothetical protein
VATALLNDLIGLFHPSHSWTGRFPPAGFAPAAPEFDRYLARAADGDAATVPAGEAGPDAVPLLESMRVR